MAAWEKSACYFCSGRDVFVRYHYYRHAPSLHLKNTFHGLKLCVQQTMLTSTAGHGTMS